MVQFNPASRVYQSKELGEETKKLITQSQSLIIDQFAYCVCRNVRKVDFVKINLLDESMETTPIYDGEHLIHFYLTGSKVDNYLHLCSERYFGESIFYSVYGMANLPDLSDYIIDKVIPLK